MKATIVPTTLTMRSARVPLDRIIRQKCENSRRVE